MEDMRSWISEIDPEELPEPYKTLAYKIGINNTMTIAQMYQGVALYLPKLDGTISNLRDKKIRKEFNGYNYRELAIKYKLTERWIRQIVDRDTVDGQINLFDDEKVTK